MSMKSTNNARDCGACRMKRVAVFGNAGGGKSTLAKRLAELTRLPLYPIDMIQFEVVATQSRMMSI
jgi:adenylate kinase family enzyme